MRRLRDAHGPRSLSVTELLALVIGSGSTGRSSLAVAHDLMGEVEQHVVELGRFRKTMRAGDGGEIRVAQLELHGTGKLRGLAQAAGRDVGLVFIPHLTPMIRGIHATLYARITREVDFQALFEKRYAGEAFVDVMPAGSHPDTRSTRAANVCRIAVHRPKERSGGSDTVVVLSVIDNLVKGAAGQAVQNMNIMFGLPETTGLQQVALSP